MSGWRVLDASEFEGSIGYVRGHLQFRSKGSPDREVPLSQIAVLLVGVKAGLSGAVLAKLSEYGAALLVCDWRRIPIAGAAPWSTHTRVGARQQAQAAVSLPRKKAAWAQLIRAKVRGQAATVSEWDASTGRVLGELARTVRSGDPANVEATAARRYWSAMARGTGFVRSPGGSRLGWNGALDYGYTVLRGHGIRAVAGAGLIGALGVHHRGRGNPFALVDDLIEPFRPAIDYHVFSRVEPFAELEPEHKSLIVGAVEQAFSPDGATIPTVFASLAQHFGAYVEGAEPQFSVPVWEVPQDAGEV